MIAFVYADWCPHCKKFKPKWNNVKKKMKNKINMVEINYEKRPDLAKKLGVTGFPTMLFIENDMTHEFEDQPTQKNIENFVKAAAIFKNGRRS